MAKSNKAQHWVPQSYLAAWVDPDVPTGYDRYINVISKDGGTLERRAPKNKFTETDLYTIHLPDGQRDLRLEHGLSQLEGTFAVMRTEFLLARRKLPLVRLTKLMVFVAAMLARTRSMRDHHAQLWGEVQRKMETLERRMRDESVDEKRGLASPMPIRDSGSMTLDEVRELAEHTMPNILEPMVSAQVPVLLNMRSVILCTDSDPGFITSDAPVAWFVPNAHMKPPLQRAPGLIDPHIEITLPISPDQLLMITHGESGLIYVDVEDFVVSELNRRTRFYCHEEFVVKRAYLESHWFDPGEEPDDSWEKLTSGSSVERPEKKIRVPRRTPRN